MTLVIKSRVARSDLAAKSLAESGTEYIPVRSRTWKTASGAADGVIPTAFIHDFANYQPAVKKARRTVEVMLGDGNRKRGKPAFFVNALHTDRQLFRY